MFSNFRDNTAPVPANPIIGGFMFAVPMSNAAYQGLFNMTGALLISTGSQLAIDGVVDMQKVQTSGVFGGFMGFLSGISFFPQWLLDIVKIAKELMF